MKPKDVDFDAGAPPTKASHSVTEFFMAAT